MIFNAILNQEINNLVTDLDLQKKAVDILKRNTAEIEDINISQLEKGEDGDGAMLAPSYRNKSYEAMKRSRLGLRTPLGVPNLRLTGETHKNIKALVSSKEIVFTVIDRYDLLKKYGEFIGLNDSGQNELKEDIIIPEMIDDIKQDLR